MQKRKSGKKVILIVSISVAVIALIVVSVIISSRAGSTKMDVSCTELKKTSLQDTISVTGTVHSKDPADVYTTLAEPVKKVSVSVGDTVKKGDILAVLDTSSLEEDIKAQEYATKSADSSANLGLEKAKTDYENALNQYNNDSGTGLTTAKANLSSAKSALDQEQQAYDTLKQALAAGKATQPSLDAEKARLGQAQGAYDSAEQAVTSARDESQQNLQAAKNVYDDAVAKSSDKSSDVALEKLRNQLQQSVITAPRDGTVTQCGVSVGDVPKESMFRIEDTSDLIVDAQIQEVDVNRVKSGDAATVTTDATGKDKINGQVVSVAPAATEDPTVQTAAGTAGGGSSNATFDAKIRITDKNTGLRIGMKAKANIVLNRKDNVFVVPYDSLVQKSNGSYVIYGAKKEGALSRTVEIPVTTGMETDISVEVSGSGLQEGMQVVTSPDGIVAGQLIQPASSSSSEGA